MESNIELVDRVIEQLKDVYDPEIPVNVYDLGLIYNISIDEANNVTIEMTLSSPGCPVGGLIEKMIKFSVKKLEEVNEVNIDLVWEPPWSNEMMSEEARLELGMM